MSIPFWAWIFIATFGFMLVMDIITLIIAFREQRPVWQFAPLKPVSTPMPGAASIAIGPDLPYRPSSSVVDDLPLPSFAMQYGRELEAMGYQFQGSYRHIKGGVYQIRFDVLLSPDRLILATVESGTIIKIPINNVTLISKGMHQNAANQVHHPERTSLLKSITAEAAFDYDVTGRIETMLFPAASLGELQLLHMKRLGVLRPQPFSDAAMEDYHRVCVEVSEEEERQGSTYHVVDSPNFRLPYPLTAVKIFLGTKKFMYGRRIYPHRWRVKRLPHIPPPTSSKHQSPVSVQ